MDKVRLIKLMRRKVYWEWERDKCFYNIFFFYAYVLLLSIIKSNYPGLKKITEIGWSQADWWDKFNYIFDWFLIIILVIYVLAFAYYLIRIQACSRKLVEVNGQFLSELSSSQTE